MYVTMNCKILATKSVDYVYNMVGIVKWLRHRVVAPVYVGSNPTSHPINVGVSPSGKAMDSDSIMRRFESCYPSQQLGMLIQRPIHMAT